MTSAFAATITINRDSSWQASTEEDRKATYTWYRIFDVDLTDADHPVYTISGTGAADKVAALDSTVFTANLASDGKYYITKKTGVSDEDLIGALGTMVDLAANATLFPGTQVTSAENPVVLNVGDPGYFYIKASNGKDVAVQTAGAVTITEKNDYPTIDKKQKKANGTYANTPLPQEIGKYIDYQVTVHIPTDATKQINVIDVMSAGLDYDEATGLTLDPNITYSELESTDHGYNANAAWQIKFTDETVVANRGSDIVITYRALVTEDAIVDTGKENEVTLDYDNGNYILKDDVDYEIYFAGIYKVDPDDADADMSGVTFYLKDSEDNAVNVTYDSTNGYYVPGGDSNIVETRADGDYYTIKIRGLDNDVTYTLTEKETKNGYNLLEGTVTLTINYVPKSPLARSFKATVTAK